MNYQWSENAYYVQAVCHPWQPEDGYDETVVAAAEQNLGLRFPSVLRQFYKSWGARHDLTNLCAELLSPVDTWLQSDALVFCLENQGVWYWGIPCDQIHQDDPSIYFAYNEEPVLTWQISHEKMSHFLDYLTFGHTLSGAALHGAVSKLQTKISAEKLSTFIRQNCREITLPSYPFAFIPEYVPPKWPIFIGDGFLLDYRPTFVTVAAASKQETLDQISQALQITWENRW